MCTAIYAAAILVALIAALTALRVKDPSSPNADLLARALNSLEPTESGRDQTIRQPVRLHRLSPPATDGCH